MPKAIDITGKRVGKLVVIKKIAEGHRGCPQRWLCKCDCGKEKIISKGPLLKGNIKSCGCERKRITKENMTKHGKRQTNLYMRWLSMKGRCLNPKNKKFKNYGERGINVCDSWKNDFMSFYDWAVRSGYKKSLSLERIDVNGNYCPENCKWIPMKEQALNKTTTVYLDVFGKKMTIRDAATFFGIKEKTLRNRHKRGWSDERAVSV